jgi:hypothetical protein
VLVEKESDCGEHASGCNSGVLRAGFYYSADSLKAQLTEVCLHKEAQPDKRAYLMDFGLYKKVGARPSATINAKGAAFRISPIDWSS